MTRRQNLWAPFRQSVASWLGPLVPPQTPLLLIAPSGGYCLDTAWLREASPHIVAADWDPLARLFFGHNHPGVSVSWHRTHLMQEAGRNLQTLLEAHPQAFILFCNFLGQASLASPRDYPEFAARLPGLLSGRRWASFHDRYSGALVPSSGLPLCNPTGRLESAPLLAHFYARSGPGELNEHHLPEFLGQLPAGTPHQYWIWPLSSNSFHLIEGVSQ